MGEKKLPWERMSPDDRKKLGAFRSPILQLLERNPAQRPTMEQFYHNCNSIFSSSVTYLPAGAAGDNLAGTKPRPATTPDDTGSEGVADNALSI